VEYQPSTLIGIVRRQTLKHYVHFSISSRRTCSPDVAVSLMASVKMHTTRGETDSTRNTHTRMPICKAFLFLMKHLDKLQIHGLAVSNRVQVGQLKMQDKTITRLSIEKSN